MLGYEANNWNGLVARPARAVPSSRACSRTSPELEPIEDTPRKFACYLAAEAQTWAALVKSTKSGLSDSSMGA